MRQLQTHQEFPDRRVSAILLVTLAVILLFHVPITWAQDEDIQVGVIEGQVLDVLNSAPLVGAMVQIVDQRIGAVTGPDGRYRIENVVPGTVNLRFALVGYAALVRTNVTVGPGRTTEVSVSLARDEIEMDAVTVTARESYFAQDPEAEVSGRTIDSQEIINAAGGLGDIQRVVQVLPSVTSGTDQINEIIVRGGNFGENLFVMDGIEIPNPNHFAIQGAGGGPISMLRNEFIDDVSFLAGAFPAKYGDKASSVMDITLRRGSTDRRLINFDMSMAGAGVMAEGPVNETGSFLFSARRSYLDLIIANTGITAVPRYYNIQGKLTYPFGRHTLLWNTVYGADSIDIEPGEDEDGDDEYVDQRTNMAVTGFTLKSALTDNLYGEGVLSFVSNNWSTVVWDEGSTRSDAMYNNDSIESETTFKYNLTWFFGRNDLSAGVALKNSRFDHDVFADGDTVFVFSPDPLFPDDREHDINVGIADDDTGNPLIYEAWRDKKKVNTLKSAVYSQIRFVPIQRLTLRIGGRYDYIDYTGDGHFAPRLGARYRLTDTLSLNAAYGIHYQSPAYLTLTANEQNRHLKDYHTEQVVLGTEWLPRPDLRMTLEGYSKRYRDVPVSKAWTTPDPWDYYAGEMVNAARGHSEGIELYVQKKMSTSYMYLLSYSFYRAWFEDPRTGEDRPWDFDHKQIFTFAGTKRWALMNKSWYRGIRDTLWFKALAWILPFGDEVTLSTQWRYTGGRPFTEPLYLADRHVWIVPETVPFNGARMPAYHRLDLLISRRFFNKGWSLVAYTDIMNLYNRDNIWEYSRDEFGVVERVSQFRTLPVGGFIIEF